jgi:hypothetical protein
VPISAGSTGEADFRLRAYIAPVAHLGAPDLDRPDPGLDRTMWPMAVTHDAVAAIRQFQVLPHGDEGVGFGDQHLSQYSASAFTCEFGQGIIDSIRLTEGDDSGIFRHGVSLLSGRFWQAWTPASIRRLQSIVVTQIPT